MVGPFLQKCAMKSYCRPFFLIEIHMRQHLSLLGSFVKFSSLHSFDVGLKDTKSGGVFLNRMLGVSAS